MYLLQLKEKVPDMSSSTSFIDRPLIRRLGIGLAALFGTLAAQAQTQAQPQTVDAFAPNTMLLAAAQTLQQIDNKQGNALYAQAPAFVKNAVKRNDFTKGVTQEREKLGAVTDRQWISIQRVVATPVPNQPPVSCANVQFAALRQNALAGSERVSLCWDQQQWRATGYVAAATPAPAPTPTPAPAQAR